MTAYDENGISYLYPFVCSWKDGVFTEEEVIKGTFKLEEENRLTILENGARIEMIILEINKRKLKLQEGKDVWKYYRMAEVRPICSREELKKLISEAGD